MHVIKENVDSLFINELLIKCKIMKLVCYLMFFLFFGITSCTSTSKEELKYGTIDVINLKLYQKENIIRLSEIADSIHYISLETLDSCLIGAIDKILRTDNDDKL